MATCKKVTLKSLNHNVTYLCPKCGGIHVIPKIQQKIKLLRGDLIDGTANVAIRYDNGDNLIVTCSACGIRMVRSINTHKIILEAYARGIDVVRNVEATSYYHPSTSSADLDGLNKNAPSITFRMKNDRVPDFITTMSTELGDTGNEDIDIVVSEISRTNVFDNGYVEVRILHRALPNEEDGFYLETIYRRFFANVELALAKI